MKLHVPSIGLVVVRLVRHRWTLRSQDSALLNSSLLSLRKSSFELCDQCSQGFRLLVCGEVTAGQTLDLEAELAQPFLRQVDLPVFKGILVAAAHEERE